MNQIAAGATTTAWQATSDMRLRLRHAPQSRDRHLDLGYQKIGVKLFGTRYWTLNAGTGPRQVGVVATLAEIVGASSSEAQPQRSSAPSLTVTSILFAVTTIRWCMPAFLVKAPSNAEAVAIHAQAVQGIKRKMLRPSPTASGTKCCVCSQLDDIPSNGYSSWSLSYISSFKYVSNAAEVLQEGYAKKHEGTPFKALTLNRWIVFISPWKSDLAVETVRDILVIGQDLVWIDLDSRFVAAVTTNANVFNIFLKFMWLIDESQESSRRQSTLHVLIINSASIHSTTNTFSRALCNLAAYPQYVGSLREEIDEVIQEHGWTKKAIALMQKGFW
ncbi:hypothetical protein PISMIDRAFT_17439 [Pisolithus microcarpus 441]|uniref:Uncharacterized protein n=1 Tax=Pisolithus microcarpus 441 TaxID=765257 RepID=A0A0C9Z2G3_9AGAM|nr:hypothetical protein PISMIDRAFT_17439 [Pisolithus microcarpus 441]